MEMEEEMYKKLMVLWLTAIMVLMLAGLSAVTDMHFRIILVIPIILSFAFLALIAWNWRK